MSAYPTVDRIENLVSTGHERDRPRQGVLIHKRLQCRCDSGGGLLFGNDRDLSRKNPQQAAAGKGHITRHSAIHDRLDLGERAAWQRGCQWIFARIPDTQRHFTLTHSRIADCTNSNRCAIHTRISGHLLEDFIVHEDRQMGIKMDGECNRVARACVSSTTSSSCGEFESGRNKYVPPDW